MPSESYELTAVFDEYRAHPTEFSHKGVIGYEESVTLPRLRTLALEETVVAYCRQSRDLPRSAVTAKIISFSHAPIED